MHRYMFPLDTQRPGHLNLDEVFVLPINAVGPSAIQSEATPIYLVGEFSSPLHTYSESLVTSPQWLP